MRMTSSIKPEVRQNRNAARWPSHCQLAIVNVDKKLVKIGRAFPETRWSQYSAQPIRGGVIRRVLCMQAPHPSCCVIDAEINRVFIVPCVAQPCKTRYCCVIVRPSVCLSHAGIEWKRLNRSVNYCFLSFGKRSWSKISGANHRRREKKSAILSNGKTRVALRFYRSLYAHVIDVCPIE